MTFYSGSLESVEVFSNRGDTQFQCIVAFDHAEQRNRYIADRHITKGKPRAPGFAVSTDDRCKLQESIVGDIGSANVCGFMRLIRLLQ